MSDPQARRFWDVARAQMRQIASDLIGERRTQSEGGPYGRVWVNKSGFVIKAEAGSGLSNGAGAFDGGGTFSLSSGSNYRHPWSSGDIIWDTGGYWDAGQPTRFTIAETGWYLITSRTAVQPTSGVYYLEVGAFVSSAASIIFDVARATPAIEDQCSRVVSGEQYLAAGDYIELTVINTHISGTPGPLDMADPYLSIRRLL